MQSLAGKVAVVAGATRGAGRGIACMLGEAGATVYCTGRSVKGKPSSINRSETIEETAEMVSSHGGTGIWAQVDHESPGQVRLLFERVRQEQGRLNILVNNMSGDQYLTVGMLSGKEPISFWDYSVEKGLATQRNGVHTHLITSYYAAPLIESVIAAGFGFCGVLGQGWPHCETRVRLNRRPLGSVCKVSAAPCNGSVPTV